MNREEILEMVDSVHRDWEMDRETVFAALEEAVAQALSGSRGRGAVEVRIDRQTGAIRAVQDGVPVNVSGLGRAAVRQMRESFHAKLKGSRSRILLRDYRGKLGTLVSAKAVRSEGGTVLCEIARRVEAALPPSNQIPGESYPAGRRFKALLVEVTAAGEDLRIIVSRTDDRLVARLFEIQVPEIQTGICRIEGTVREPGHRTKILVGSTNDRVDCVGACVGEGGARIKNVVLELGGENVDIIPTASEPRTLVRNAMKPALVDEVKVDPASRRATAYVARSELSQAIGKGGRNVRLASRLTGWEIDVFERQIGPFSAPVPRVSEDEPSAPERCVREDSPARAPQSASEGHLP